MRTQSRKKGWAHGVRSNRAELRGAESLNVNVSERFSVLWEWAVVQGSAGMQEGSAVRTEREPDGAGDGARQVHEREARAALRVPDEAVARVPDDPLGGSREVLRQCASHSA